MVCVWSVNDSLLTLRAEGEIEAPWLIFALTIVFPLLAAVFTIKTIAQRGRGSAVPKASKKRN